MEDVSYTKGFPVSWEELHRTAKALAWRLFELPQFVGVIAITNFASHSSAVVTTPVTIISVIITVEYRSVSMKLGIIFCFL